MTGYCFDCRSEEHWLPLTLESLRDVGFAVVTGVLDAPFLDQTRQAMYEAQKRILKDVGEERLRRAGELGVLRLMMKYQPHFFRFLEIPEVLQVVDQTVGDTAILHLQNGFILPSFKKEETPQVFQNRFHWDFPRYLNGYLASINTYFAIDAFRGENGATFVVPGSHQKPEAPDLAYMEQAAIPVECPAGSMIVFDSTLWHAAGENTSGADRLGINHQFTRSYIKQQIDYVRALGEGAILSLPPRSQQLLGYYTRVVTSLDEYYQPEEKRLYRRGQG